MSVRRRRLVRQIKMSLTTLMFLLAVHQLHSLVSSAEEGLGNNTPYAKPTRPIDADFLRLLHNHSLYNRYATPTQFTDETTTVAVYMYVEAMSAFSAKSMAFNVDMYFQQEWQDPRLVHNDSRILIRDKAVLDTLWHPDIYFANARKASFQDVTQENFLVWIYEDGTVWYDCRISLEVTCMMNLMKYPLDGQNCELRLLSWLLTDAPNNSHAYDNKQLKIIWGPNVKGSKAVSWNKKIKMPDMNLINITTSFCDGTYPTGVWSCLRANFKVKREILQHLIQTYLPTTLIVVISWFSFWLDVDSAPARVSLAITTLLTISTQANAVKLTLPEVSYMKAIDIWIGVCLGFVFGVMIEFTICHFARMRQELAAEKEEGEQHKGQLTRGLGAGLEANFSPLLLRDDRRLLPAINSTNTLISAQASPDINDVVAETAFVGRQQQQQQRRLHQRSASPATQRRRHYSMAASLSGDEEMEEECARESEPRTDLRKVAVRLQARARSVTRRLRALRGRKAAAAIDQKCRYLFPLAFLLFNIVYWGVFQLNPYWPDIPDDDA